MVFEGMTKKKWVILLLIVLAITVLRTMMQPLIPEAGPAPFPTSVFVETGLMPIAFVIYGVVMLGLLALVFVLIQDRLPGTKLLKGVTFSLAFGMLWFVYLLELLPHGPWQVPSSFYYPIVDGVTLASLGLLLGAFVATDSKKPANVQVTPGLVAVLAIPAAFMAGRLLSYNVFHIYSLYDARPLDTMLWVAALGLWTGIMHLLLRPGVAGKSPVKTAVFFGVVVFGVNIFLNDMFMPIPFEMAVWGMGTFTYQDMIVRTVTDVASVTLGVFLYEMLRSRLSGNSQTSSKTSA